MIVDFHCHIASELFFPPSFIDGVVDNFVAAIASQGLAPRRDVIARMYRAKMQDPLCDELIAQMDEAGIQRAVLLLPDFTYALRDARMTIADMVDHHRMVLARHPGRFWVMLGVDPRWGADGLALFEKAITEYGFHGLKLYPPCGYTTADRRLYPYYEICASRRLPVLTHIGATSPVLSFEEALPIYIDAPAKAFPRANFVLAHGSVHYRDECMMLCRNRPNVYLDVSGFTMRPAAELQPLLQHGLVHKVLFGTDWPIFRLQGTQKAFVDRLGSDEPAMQGVSAADRALFLFRNAERLMGATDSAGRAADPPTSVAAHEM